MDSHLIVNVALGLFGLLVSGLSVYVGLTIRVAVAKLETALVQQRLEITQEGIVREEKVKAWAEAAFVHSR
jgi:hypothetical protein